MSNTNETKQAPEQYRVERSSDMSVTVTFPSCRLASVFERRMRNEAKQAPAVEAGARDERATFEKFAKGKFNLSPLKGEGDLLYERENTDSAWKGWQARSALARASEAAAGEAVAQAVEKAAQIADKYACGACGMDGKCAAEIRRIIGDQSQGVFVATLPELGANAAPQPASEQQAERGLSDEQIIERCKAAGIKWIPPEPAGDCDSDLGFTGSFDMASMDEMRTLLAAKGDGR